ncbi:MAG: ABC transporter permease [Actinomycetota bacterium]|jgi:branched-subunit amino acid ABC-type transport system permease component
MLNALIVGVVTGSIYGIAALGLTLTYKTSGIFNFAHGALAAAAAYMFYALRQDHGLAWPLAALVSILLFGILGGLILERIAAALADVPLTLKIVGTLGLLLAVQGLCFAIFGHDTRIFADFLPTTVHRIAGAAITTGQLIIVGIGLAAVVGLSAYFRLSRSGTAMRAVVDDPILLDMTGVDPLPVRRRAWIIGSVFACASGVLIAPAVGLNAAVLTLLVVQSFGAAAIGLFRNLSLTYAGGLAVGVLAALSNQYLARYESLRTLPFNVSFLLLFLVLVFAGGRLKELGSPVRARVGAALPLGWRLLGTAAGIVTLVAIPFVVGSKIVLFQVALAYVMIFLSLGLLVRLSGQISLCQMTFAAIGASSSAHLVAGAGVPWLVGVLLAGLVAVPVGAFLALPAIRLSGVYLALATLGFGILLNQMGYMLGVMFGQTSNRDAPRPSFGGSDRGYYFVCLAIVAVAVVIVLAVQRAQLGRLLRGVADSPVALSTHGASISVTLVLVFCLSAFLAAIGGALLAPVTQYAASPDYAYFTSLLLLAVHVIAGGGVVVSPFIAAFILQVVPAYAESQTLTDYLPVIFGLSALGAVLMARTAGRHQILTSFVQRIAAAERQPALTFRPRGLILSLRPLVPARPRNADRSPVQTPTN